MPDAPIQATAQHHDAIAGTEKQHVAYDYARRIARGRLVADSFASGAFAKLTAGYDPAGGYATCDLSNATICKPLESGSPTLVVLYNARGAAVESSPVRVAVGVTAGSFDVTDALGHLLPAQLLPLSAADLALRNEYYGAAKPAAPLSWLAWQADLPAAGKHVCSIARCDHGPITLSLPCRLHGLFPDADRIQSHNDTFNDSKRCYGYRAV